MVAAPLFGQSFEVASVKVAAASAGAPVIHEDGAQLAYTNVPLILLIMRPHRVKYRQVVGPDRLGTERYDVLAKLPDGVGKDHIPQMLQTLLAERFRLAVHTEARMIPGYALQIARNGPRMKLAENADGARRTKGPQGIEIKGNTTMAKLADVLADALDRWP